MAWSRRDLLAATASYSVGFAGCSGEPSPATPKGTPTMPPTGVTYAYTHVRASGNRVLDGSGDVAGTNPVDIPIRDTPAWLLALGDGRAAVGAGTAEGVRVWQG